MSEATFPYHAIPLLLPEALLVLDVTSRRIVVANAAASRLLGYPEAEIVGATPEKFLLGADRGFGMGVQKATDRLPHTRLRPDPGCRRCSC